MAEDSFNIATFVDSASKKHPYKVAVHYPYSRDKDSRVAYTHLTYEQFSEESNRFANGLMERGVGVGSRVSLLVPPSLEFVALFFALLKIGAVPVLVDPGMGVFRMVSCLGEVTPDTYIGIPMAHVARVMFRKHFRSVKLPVTIGKRLFWGGITLKQLRSQNSQPVEISRVNKDDMAAIFFTTGSTGIPKGVVYTYGMLHSLLKAVHEVFRIDENTVDMPAFPPFALFTIAFGGTSVIPDMDPTKPAQVNPVKLAETVRDFGVNLAFGSPAIWRQLSGYCVAKDIKLPSMQRILMFGAPAPGFVLERFEKVLSNGDVYTPYGATEALLVASISGSEIRRETLAMSREGKGTCVGDVMPGIELKIIKITDDKLSIPEGGIDTLCVPRGTVGEIIVRGEYITREYYRKPEETAKAKIKDGNTIWHRMGDLGYLDDKDRLWFVGRKAHRIKRDGKEYYSVMVESYFNQLQDVSRSAMVGVPSEKLGQEMVMVIEPVKGKMPRGGKQRKERSEYFLSCAREKNLSVDAVLFHPSFPVDIRHNAKIRREELALWAGKKLKRRSRA